VFSDAQLRTMQSSEGGLSGWTDPREGGDLPDVYIAMGQTAENVALLKDVSREEMDEFAARSQQLTEKAIADGFWERDVVPITTPDGQTVVKDDGPRPGTTVEGLAGLKPVFRPDGRVTAGNACPLNDGAAAVIVMSDTKAEQLGLQPLARIVSTAVTGLSPEIMGLGPVDAIQLALQRAGNSVDDIDLFEINEAFAAQVIPSYKEVGIPLDKLNVHGGAIAVGHPFGMTGARITSTLLNGLQVRDGRFGVESMCVGGGMGMAMVLERL
jgi:acetyl-CoA C-acetyltransferase